MTKTNVCVECKYYVPTGYTLDNSRREATINYKGYCKLRLPRGAAIDVNQTRMHKMKACTQFVEKAEE